MTKTGGLCSVNIKPWVESHLPYLGSFARERSHIHFPKAFFQYDFPVCQVGYDIVPRRKNAWLCVYCMIQQYIHMFHWKCIWGPVKICGSLKFRGSPIVLHGNGLVIIYIAWMLVLVSCFVSPLSFCMVWGNQTFWIITRRLISWTYTLNHFEVASNIYIYIYVSVAIYTSAKELW